ncbi:MAG: hypothetical protein ACRBDL_08005 [Alphaproteobacteria bacterium]
MDKSLSKSATAIMQNANAGDADAQYGLGILYTTSWKDEVDSENLARHWLEKAVAQEHPDAQSALDNMNIPAEEALVLS